MNTKRNIGINWDYFQSLMLTEQEAALEMASKPNLYRWAEAADQPTVRATLRQVRSRIADMQARREAAQYMLG